MQKGKREQSEHTITSHNIHLQGQDKKGQCWDRTDRRGHVEIKAAALERQEHDLEESILSMKVKVGARRGLCCTRLKGAHSGKARRQKCEISCNIKLCSKGI